MSVRVTVPENAPIAYPPLCVRCAAPDPAATFALRGESSGALNRILSLFAAALPDLRYAVPCCPGCKRRLWLRHWGATVGVALWGVSMAALLFGVLPALDLALGETASGLAWFGLVFGAMLAVYVFLPPYVRLSTEHGEAVFSFRDRRFAEAFAEANGAVDRLG